MTHPLSVYRHCPRCGGAVSASSPKSVRCAACGLEVFVNPSAAYVAVITDAAGRVLVERRGREPAKGTLDLPGGFADMGETAEEGVAREVREETGLRVVRTEYLFSRPNTYHYGGMTIPTLDMFFRCEVATTAGAAAADDAAELLWLRPEEVRPEEFGLESIRAGVRELFLKPVGGINSANE